MSEDLKQVIRDEEIKNALKEALREWLNEQFAAVGKWTLRGILAAALGVLVYLILTIEGWRPPQ